MSSSSQPQLQDSSTPNPLLNPLSHEDLHHSSTHLNHPSPALLESREDEDRQQDNHHSSAFGFNDESPSSAPVMTIFPVQLFLEPNEEQHRSQPAGQARPVDLEAELSAPSDQDHEANMFVPPPVKKARRRYDNNFKAQVLEHLKIPGIKLPALAKQYNIPENTLREWTKVTVVQKIETARAKNSGQLKANMYDPMSRLTESLMTFFERNEHQPQHLQQPVTTKLIVAKGREARNDLLKQHQIHPFLDLKEKKALEIFSGSDSWAKKFAKRHNLKMTGTRIKELSEEDVNQYHQSLKQITTRMKQAGPGYEEVAALLRQAGEKLLQAGMTVTSPLSRNKSNDVVMAGRLDIEATHQNVREAEQPIL